MIYKVGIGRKNKNGLLPDLVVLVETEEILIAVLSCCELENSNYVVKEVNEINGNANVFDLLRSNNHGRHEQQSRFEKND